MCFAFSCFDNTPPLSPQILPRTILVSAKVADIPPMPMSAAAAQGNLGKLQVSVVPLFQDPAAYLQTYTEQELKLQSQALRIAELERQLAQNEERDRQTIAALQATIDQNIRSSHENNIVFSYTNHEVRNIIQSLLATIESVKHDQLLIPNELNKAWTSIHYLAKELSPLLNTGLDLAKIFNHKMELEQKRFSYIEFKNTVIAQFACRNKEGVEFQFIDSPSIPPYLIGDPHRLNQILTNLITNAFKFTEKGSVTVIIEVVSLKSGEVTLNFGVKDTGKGIPGNVIETLGQPFRQADVSIARQSGGTGLGLYISKLLINLMNGNAADAEAQRAIKIESTVGQGSIFSFNARFKVVSAPVLAIHLPESPLSNCRVLLADDDNVSLKLMKKKLEQQGAQVSTATNGQEVLGMASQGYDAILLDMRMPVMDGFATARELKYLRQTSHPNIPIPIPCSGNSSPEDQRSYQAAGMNRFLSKPFTINEAVEVVLKSKEEVLKKQNLD